MGFQGLISSRVSIGNGGCFRRQCDEVITARIELGDAGWSVPGQGSFRVVDRDGERVVVVTFEGTAVSPNDAVAPGAPETTVILDATFGPPA